MITKQCQFSGSDEQGVYAQLIYPGEYNDHLTKTSQASPPQLECAREIIYNAPKKSGHIYTFVSAMGAGEYWGSNSNGDDFPEEPLVHVPPGWNEMSHSRQRTVGKTWEWGYPTFYNAHAFQHHVNKDPARAFGTVYHTSWDVLMKRVLLILQLSSSAATRMGAQGILDRIENGEFPDVSMGCKVPFDVCSVCADWERIIPLLGKPKQLLAEHKKKPIRGISVTRDDYCQHLRHEINKIYPDGKKVRMMNFHPRFFDISHVFIGADKTSKVMAKLAGEQLCPIRDHSPMCKKGCYTCGIPSSHVHEVWSRETDMPKEKVAIGPSLSKAFGPALKGMAGGSALGAVGGAGLGGAGADLEGAESSVGSGALKGALAGAALGGTRGSLMKTKAISSYIKHTPARKMMRQSDKDFDTAKVFAAKVDKALAVGDQKAADIAADEAFKFKALAQKGRNEAFRLADKIKTSSDGDAELRELFQAAPQVKTAMTFGQAAGRHIARTGVLPGAAAGGVLGGATGAALSEEDRLSGAAKGAVGGAVLGGLGGGLAGARRMVPAYDDYSSASRYIDEVDDITSRLDEHMPRHNEILEQLKKSKGGTPEHSRLFSEMNDVRRSLGDYPGNLKLERKMYADMSDDAYDKMMVPFEQRGKAVAQSAGVAAPLGVGAGLVAKNKKQEPEEEKLASLFGIRKQSEIDINKKAEIIKKIRSNFSNALPQMESEEPEIPKELLDSLGKDLPDALASAGSMGIVAKPKEFQRMILIARGQPKLADDLDEKGICFNQGASPSKDQMVGKIIPKILDMLSPLMGERSALGPPMHKRIIRITIVKPMDRKKELPEELSDSPILDKISADYSAYRQQLLHKTASLVNQLTHEHPAIIADLLGDLHINSLSGGLVKAGGDVMESVIGMFPIDYMNKAYLDNPVSEYMDTNCDLSSLVTIGDLASCGKVA